MTSSIDHPPAAPLEPLEEPPAAGTSLRELATPAAATAERSMPGHLVHVVLEDRSEFTVRVDNRDFIRWDKTAPRQKWDAKVHPFIFQSFLAWAAARRQNLTGIDFERFMDTALQTKDVPAGPEDAARPTQ